MTLNTFFFSHTWLISIKRSLLCPPSLSEPRKSVFFFPKALHKNKYNRLLVLTVMCYSVTSRGFLWPRLSVKPRQDLIAVTLRGFSQFLTELRQLSVLSVWAQPLWVSNPDFPVLKVLYNDYSPNLPCCLLMCFYKSSLGGQRHHKQESHRLGCYRVPLDEIFRTASSSSVSVAHVPRVCTEKLGVS